MAEIDLKDQLGGWGILTEVLPSGWRVTYEPGTGYGVTREVGVRMLQGVRFTVSGSLLVFERGDVVPGAVVAEIRAWLATHGAGVGSPA
jgi:hypothetical protein